MCKDDTCGELRIKEDLVLWKIGCYEGLGVPCSSSKVRKEIQEGLRLRGGIREHLLIAENFAVRKED